MAALGMGNSSVTHRTRSGMSRAWPCPTTPWCCVPIGLVLLSGGTLEASMCCDASSAPLFPNVAPAQTLSHDQQCMRFLFVDTCQHSWQWYVALTPMSTPYSSTQDLRDTRSRCTETASTRSRRPRYRVHHTRAKYLPGYDRRKVVLLCHKVDSLVVACFIFMCG
jgi:hypothetical protein